MQTLRAGPEAVSTTQLSGDNSYFQENYFRPTINSRSREIASGLKKPPIYIRYREELQNKKENVEYIARKLQEQQKRDEERLLAQSSRSRTLSASKSRTRGLQNSLGSLPLYEKNMDWLNRKNSRLTQLRYQSQAQSVEQEQQFASARRSAERVDPALRVALDQQEAQKREFWDRQESHEKKKRQKAEQLSAKELAQYSFKPRAFRTSGSAARAARPAERSVEFAATRASELRRTKSKESLKRLAEVEQERILRLVQEQTPLAPEPAAPKVVRVSDSLNPTPAKKRELAQIPERRTGPSTVLQPTTGGFSRRAVKPAKKKAPAAQPAQPPLPPKKKAERPGAKKPKPRETGKVYYSINSKLESAQPLDAP